MSHPDTDHVMKPGLQLIAHAEKEFVKQKDERSLRFREYSDRDQLTFDFMESSETDSFSYVVIPGNHDLKQDGPVSSPRIAEYLAWLLPQTHREALVGDLLEQYPKVKSKFGKRKADFWAYMQVITSVTALISTFISKLRLSTR